MAHARSLVSFPTRVTGKAHDNIIQLESASETIYTQHFESAGGVTRIETLLPVKAIPSGSSAQLH
jgi:hypothetical protein